MSDSAVITELPNHIQAPIPFDARLEVRLERPKDMFGAYWGINAHLAVMGRCGIVLSLRKMGGATKHFYQKKWITSVYRRDGSIDEHICETELEVEDVFAAAFEADYLTAGVA
jgi:hypothetical protein